MGEKVVRMRRPTGADDEKWIWRQAVYILAQLPEDEEMALRVLEKATDMLRAHQAEIKPA